MDAKLRRRIQLDCLYEMFRDRIEENVVYIVYTENDEKIDNTIDQLMTISSSSFTGHFFEQSKPLVGDFITNATNNNLVPTDSTNDANKFNKNKKQTTDTNKKLRDISDLNTEKPNNEKKLTIEERIESIQAAIDDLLSEKKSSHDKACQYMSKKMYPVTSYYSELSSQLRKMIEDKTNQLVNLLIEKSQNSDTIDLHGLNPIQARLVVSELLRIRQEKLMIDKQGCVSMDIITGWGKHSVSQGQHRIRPTILTLLREKGIEYQYLNKGALRVTIRRNAI